MSHKERVVVLVDMDCFYCQVEEKLDPDLRGKPIAVVQYNEWRGGGIIAVNYPARDKGVTRHMRGDEAKEKCPEIVLARVPQTRGKADLTKYREAGKQVAEVLQTFTTLLERASVDEAYLDITEVVNKRLRESFTQIHIDNMQNTFVVGCDTGDFLENIMRNREFSESNCKLAMGGVIVEEIRRAVWEKTGYKCSAGIAHNKILAKLACGLHKPNKQTILPQDGVPLLYEDLPIRKIKSLGGKFGNTLAEELQITYMGQLTQFTETQLVKKFDEKTGHWLYNIARGIDLEPVTTRLISKSIGCCKRFPGKSALKAPEDVEHWMTELASEISERLSKDLEENCRRAKQMVISFSHEINTNIVSSSRTVPLNSYETSKIAHDGLEVLKKFCHKRDGNYHVTFLGISVGNFQDNKETINITSLFKNMGKKSNQVKSQIQDSTISDLSVPNENDTLLTDNQENDYSNEDCDDRPGDISNKSIYSATTEESNDDTDNLIYFEDIFPECVSSQPILNVDNTAQNKNISSISSNELSNLRKSSSLSFFTKYFGSCPSNDSKSSKQNDSYCSSKLNIMTPLPSEEGSSLEGVNEDCFEICLECNKKILISDMVSHKDYHFALKLVKCESHLYKPLPVVMPSNTVIDKMPCKSMNKNELEKKSILQYFKKDCDLNDTNSEICSLCGRRIKFEDVETHADYHTAKALLMKDSMKKEEPKIQGIKRSSSSINPIISFFDKSEKLDETNSKHCSKCNKRIKLDDVDSHKDYHVAKELTKELNSFVPQSQGSRKDLSEKVKKKSSIIGISSFFKSK